MTLATILADFKLKIDGLSEEQITRLSTALQGIEVTCDLEYVGHVIAGATCLGGRLLCSGDGDVFCYDDVYPGEESASLFRFRRWHITVMEEALGISSSDEEPEQPQECDDPQ